jgi:hypothetical protein
MIPIFLLPIIGSASLVTGGTTAVFGAATATAIAGKAIAKDKAKKIAVKTGVKFATSVAGTCLANKASKSIVAKEKQKGNTKARSTDVKPQTAKSVINGLASAAYVGITEAIL